MRLIVPLEIDPAVFDGWRKDAPVVDCGGETMGTTWHIRLAAPESFVAEELRSAVEAKLEAILAEMSHWRADSVIGRFNRAPGDTWLTLPRDFAQVLQAALDVAARSGGTFDPTIGRVVDLWGHGPQRRQAPAGPGEIAAALGQAGAARLAWEPETRRLRQPGGLHLDLSGIAKGFAVDALGVVLRERGIRHALVEIGGELLGMGLRPDADPWWVDVETPSSEAQPMRVALHGMAIATSGDYVRGRHTIDPRSGTPVDHAVAVTVLHASAMRADAWATALSVHAPADMRRLAEREGLCVRALFREGGRISEWLSPSLMALTAETDTAAAVG